MFHERQVVQSGPRRLADRQRQLYGNMFHGASAFDQDLGWCVDHVALCDDMDERVRQHPVRVDVVRRHARHLLGPGKNRSGVGLVLVIVICLILAICVPLAVSFCFLAGTFGSCSKHKKTQ